MSLVTQVLPAPYSAGVLSALNDAVKVTPSDVRRCQYLCVCTRKASKLSTHLYGARVVSALNDAVMMTKWNMRSWRSILIELE